jgi:hypothetical protein
MTSLKQTEANRANAQKSTGPVTPEGKQRSRCNALRHGLTAEVIIGALEDAEDYQAFEQGIVADYDAQSTVERELVRRLAGVFWRLRRATTIETGLFEIQADHQSALRARQGSPASQGALYALFGRNMPSAIDQALPAHDIGDTTSDMSAVKQTSAGDDLGSGVKLARCFLRLANLPNFALDRLSRYEFTLWRQARQILSALDDLNRCKPNERRLLSISRTWGF